MSSDKGLGDVMAILQSTASTYTPKVIEKKERTAEEKEKRAREIAARLKEASNDFIDYCKRCKKQVYPAEKREVQWKTKKECYHSGCFRCLECNILLDLKNYETINGDIFCELHARNRKDLSKWSNNVVSSSSTFVPVEHTKTIGLIPAKEKTSDAVVSTVKKFGEEADASSRCGLCNKKVYLVEKVDVDIKGVHKVYHRTCFKCTTCARPLDIRNFGSHDGTLYCNPHLIEARPQMAKGDYFLSPLKADSSTQIESSPQVGDEQPKEVKQPLKPSEDKEPTKNRSITLDDTENDIKKKERDERIRRLKQDESELTNEEQQSTREEERRRRREEREKKYREEEQRIEEERKKREEMRQKRSSISSSASSSFDSEDVPIRRRSTVEESLEEADRKAEERRKRLEALRSNRG